MLKLYDFFYLILKVLFLNIFLYSFKIFEFIFFYPLSIFFAILVLLWIFFILVISANIFTFFNERITYLTRFFYVLHFNYFYRLSFVYAFINMLNNIFFFFSEYFFIFHLKRIEFYLFLFFLMCLFL